MKLLIFLLILHEGYAQFGEIASIIGSLVSGPASSLIGSSALAGAGAAPAAVSGAAGALGGLGQLYQLAQGALQLTGTGVGILNQASESSWFPAAIDSVAKANRDFQDRLLAGQKVGGGLISPSPRGIIKPIVPVTPGIESGENLGTEYGKNFGNGIDGTEEVETSFSETTDETTDEWETPETTTDATATPSRSWETKETTTTESSPDYYETHAHIKIPSPDAGDDELIKPVVEVGSKKEPIVTFSSFSIDEKPVASVAEEKVDVNEETVEVNNKANGGLKNLVMVPQLSKLIQELKNSRLTKHEFLELAKQLEDNKNVGEPRENSTPAPKSKSSEDSGEQPITDGEMNEAEKRMQEVEKRLNESISRLNESLKPRIFDAPTLKITKPDARSQAIVNEFVNRQMRNGPVNVEKILNNQQNQLKPAVRAVTAYPPTKQTDSTKDRNLVQLTRPRSTRKPYRRYVHDTHPIITPKSAQPGVKVYRKAYSTTSHRISNSPPKVGPIVTQGQRITPQNHIPTIPNYVPVNTYSNNVKPNLNHLSNLLLPLRAPIQPIRPSFQGYRITNNIPPSHNRFIITSTPFPIAYTPPYYSTRRWYS